MAASLEELTAEYEARCKKHGRRHICAFEQLYEVAADMCEARKEELTEQHEWLVDFNRRWWEAEEQAA